MQQAFQLLRQQAAEQAKPKARQPNLRAQAKAVSSGELKVMAAGFSRGFAQAMFASEHSLLMRGLIGMVVLSSTQHPTEIQHKVAQALRLPMAAVRVETRRMGGGFGGARKSCVA